jgi:uncharacterized protein
MAMSTPSLRRADLAMTDEQVLRALECGFVGRLATLSDDGYPYCVPLLYVWLDNQVFVHGTGACGHLRANVERQPQACFEIDEPDEVFDYGRFECDTGLAFRSVILFGSYRGGWRDQTEVLRAADGKVRQAELDPAQKLLSTP